MRKFYPAAVGYVRLKLGLDSGRAFHAEARVEVRLGSAALCANGVNRGIVVPGFLSSQLHGSQPRGALNGAERAVSAFELVRDGYAGYAREPLHNQPTAN
jgi:hypothetical protein